jgi:hypothetical protein
MKPNWLALIDAVFKVTLPFLLIAATMTFYSSGVAIDVEVKLNRVEIEKNREDLHEIRDFMTRYKALNR